MYLYSVLLGGMNPHWRPQEYKSKWDSEMRVGSQGRKV